MLMNTLHSRSPERAALKRFFSRAVRLLPAILIVPATNFLVDPANVFAKQGEQETLIARELLAGKYVANFAIYDDRLIARYLLEHRPDRPGVLILGSSKTLNIGGYLFPNSNVVNASMLGATVREPLAAYEILRERHLIPDTVVIGVDPWMLNARAYDSRWVALQPYFDSAIRRLGIGHWPSTATTEVQSSRIQALTSADYFQQSVLAIGNKKKLAPWKVSDTPDNDSYTRLPDGSDAYSIGQRSYGPDSAEALARKYTDKGVYLIEDHAKVDATHVLALGRFIDLIRRDGAVPIVALLPYHPIVYETLSADPRYSLVLAAEDAVRKLATLHGAKVVGSYNPDRAGVTRIHFYDGHHLTERGLSVVFHQ